MPLNSFFSINMPRGIARNSNGQWWAFNRDYAPLGFNKKINVDITTNTEYPIHTAYKSLNEATLLALAYKSDNPEDGIRRDEKNEINTVFFYNDSTDPSLHDSAKLWDQYFERLKRLAKFQKK